MLKHSIRYLQGSLTYFTQHIIAILILFSQYSNFLQFAFDFISIGTSMASSILRKDIVILAHPLTNLQKLPLFGASGIRCAIVLRSLICKLSSTNIYRTKQQIHDNQLTRKDHKINVLATSPVCRTGAIQ